MLRFLYVLLAWPAYPVFSQQQLPKIIKPAPEAAAITRHAIFPVSYSTGMPNISIPLYNIQVKDFNLPVSISYNASGVKVNDLASFVGLSWNLEAGGAITRVIVGRADEHPRGVLAHGIRRENEADYQYCVDATLADLERLDTEPDLFYYSFAGLSGKFYFGRTQNEIISVPYNDLKITYANGIFQIIDTNGITYAFSKTSISTSRTGDAPFDGGVTSWYLTKILLSNKLDSIKLAYEEFGSGVMKSYGYSSLVGGEPYLYCAPPPIEICEVLFAPRASASVSVTDQMYGNVYVKDITFPGGNVEFLTEGDRQDYGDRILKEVIVTTGNGTILKHFQLQHSYFTAASGGYNIYAASQDLIRLRLDRLVETGGTKSIEHRFEYNAVQLPPRKNCGVDYWGYYNGANGNKTLMSDLDGGTTNSVYYNREDRNYLLDPAQSQLADRRANEIYMEACVLKRIYYPTDGYTEFDFEPHQFMGEKTVPNGGSEFAVAKLTDLPNDPYRVKEFTPNSNTIVLNLSIPLYNEINRPYIELADLTAGTTPIRYTTFPEEPTQRTTTVPAISGHLYRITTHIQPNPNDPNEDPDLKTVSVTASWSSGVIAVSVLKKEGGLRIKSISGFDSNDKLLEKQSFKYGDNEDGIGKLSFFSYLFNRRTYEQNYYYSFFIGGLACPYYLTTRLHIQSEPLFTPSDIGGSKIFYTKVTKYSEDHTGRNNGKTEYTFDFELDDRLDNNYHDPATLVSMAWKCGNQLSEKYFKNEGGQFVAIKEIRNEHQLFEKNSYYGLKIGNVLVSVPHGCDAMLNYNTMNNYYAVEYPITSGIKKLIRTTEINFKPDGITPSLVTATNYFYDNLLHLQPTRTEFLDSKGTVTKAVIKYPHDKAAIANLDVPASQAIDALVSQNRIGEVIEKEMYKGSSLVNRTRAVHHIWSPAIVEPKILQFQQGNFPLEDRIQFHNYDLNGNTLEQSQSQDVRMSYIWDYNNQYPVAEVSNASQNAIAYSSFESDNNGNWSIPSLLRDNTLAVTGIKSYIMSNGAIAKSNLSNTQTYIVSYWAKDDSNILVNSSSAVAVRSLNGWTYFEKLLSNISSVTISGTGSIDELRLYPSQAQMTTYTYNPGVGVTTITDANSSTVYYEYDEFERLKLIRDERKSILKTYTYKYKSEGGYNLQD